MVVSTEDPGRTLVGIPFLNWLALSIGEELGHRAVLIGELTGDHWDHIRAVAVAIDGRLEAPLTYHLRDTPCANVVGQEPCVFEHSVATLFPEDSMLTEMGAECYAGAPVFDSRGRPLGLIVALDVRPMTDRATVLSVLCRFRDRVAAELERRRVVEELDALVAGSSAVSTSDFFGSLVRSLSTTFRSRSAIAGEWLDDGSIRVLAVYCDGAVRDGFKIEDGDGPIAQLLHRETYAVPRALRECYPSAHDILALGGESFSGVRLTSRSGRPIGFLAVLDEQAIEAGFQSRVSLMQILAARAEAELDRKHAEDERERVVEQKSESLRVFAGGLAHDLNNLLMIVLGNTQLVRRKLGTTSIGSEPFDSIETAAQRAAGIANQLLICSGRARIVPKAIDCIALVDAVVDSLRPTVGPRIVIRVEHAQPACHCLGEATQLRSVVDGLLANAVEALGDASGEIRVSTGADPDIGGAGIAWIVVADTGPGMSADVLSRIFDPFFSTKFTGRGLGLPTAQGVVRAHGGTLEVASTLGRGTTCTMRLPWADAVAPAPRSSFPPATNLRHGLRVLVIDDEPAVCAVIATALRDVGHDAVIASSGTSGIEAFLGAARPFDVVLLDWTMPHIDGREVLERLHAIDESARVVLMSGYAEHDARERFDGFGLAGYLHKPFGDEQLLAVLSGAMDIT